MARIRTIKPEFWADEKLAPLDPLTRLVFLGLISQADDAGRLLDSVRLIDGLLFPMTEDTSSEALEVLDGLGLIERGVTASGQGVIQITGWDKHQKIEKANLRAALPAVAIADQSAKRRRRVPERLRLAIVDRDGGVCQQCGVEVKVNKSDRYDNAPNLAEIDHIVAVADGGSDDPQNLQLLCLACNRKKAGEAVRRRNAEASGKGRGSVGDESQNHTYDLRPTTNDLKNSDANASGAVAPKSFQHLHNGEPSPGRLMALIRDGDPETETLGLYGHSRKPPHSRTEGQDFDTITTLIGKGVKPSQIEAWVIGAAMIREAGLLAEWCKPGESMSLGAMYLNKDGIRPFALTAEAYYHQQLERGAAKNTRGMARLKVEVG